MANNRIGSGIDSNAFSFLIIIKPAEKSGHNNPFMPLAMPQVLLKNRTNYSPSGLMSSSAIAFPVLTTRSLNGHFRILMSYKIMKKE
jgi:hypothetical protein